MAEISKETRDALLRDLSDEDLAAERARRETYGVFAATNGARCQITRCTDIRRCVCLEATRAYVWNRGALISLVERLNRVIQDLG